MVIQTGGESELMYAFAPGDAAIPISHGETEYALTAAYSIYPDDVDSLPKNAPGSGRKYYELDGVTEITDKNVLRSRDGIFRWVKGGKEFRIPIISARPDFSSVATHEVLIQATGDYGARGDFKTAWNWLAESQGLSQSQITKLSETHVWHHAAWDAVNDQFTMQLVPKEIHSTGPKGVSHTGAVSDRRAAQANGLTKSKFLMNNDEVFSVIDDEGHEWRFKRSKNVQTSRQKAKFFGFFDQIESTGRKPTVDEIKSKGGFQLWGDSPLTTQQKAALSTHITKAHLTETSYLKFARDAHLTSGPQKHLADHLRSPQ